MNDDHLKQLEVRYQAAIEQASPTSECRPCHVCGQCCQCRERPTGLLSTPLVWMCETCWSYATETA